MTSTASKIKFCILGCSGEDPEYPVTELLTQSSQSKGWHSSRFCDFPQEITLQFMSPIKIKQTQFLSHQCKIASKIELYSYLPDSNSIIPNNDFKYKKLGYLSLDSNERSGFKSRELKSVYLDAPALYLKIRFHKCHTNKHNLFNQVALIALNIFGEPNGIITPTAGPIQSQKYDKLEYKCQFDPATLEKLKSLEIAKERAVKDEEFEEAKRLKEAIERLKQIGTQIQNLEEKKAIAIRNEDYDSAKIIKIEIERLKNSGVPENLARNMIPKNDPILDVKIDHNKDAVIIDPIQQNPNQQLSEKRKVNTQNK